MTALEQGILSGITVSLMIGPIFFGLVDLTITKGWRSGLAYVAGIVVIDIILIMLVENLLNRIDFHDIKQPMGIIGGILLLVFGIVIFMSKASTAHAPIEDIKTLFQAFVKGIVINVLNPFVTVWWITMYTTFSINYDSIAEKIQFYFGILLMVFLFDLVKIRFAYFLKQKLTIDKLIIVKKIAGVCLFVFGIVMIVRVL